MKKLIIFLGMVAGLFIACEKDDYPVYDISQTDGVFLAYNENTDSVFYNFGFDSKTEYVYHVTVKLMGMPRNYDRTIKLKVNSDKYANDEFVAAKQSYYQLDSAVVFPKDSVQTTIPVKLIRDAELEDVRAILTFELEDSEDLLVKGHREFTIAFDDKLPTAPGWWRNCVWKYGAFSKFKGQLFFKYFWEMESENKYLFDKIVARWGRNLDKTPNTYANAPMNVYPYAFGMYVEMKMWEYSEAHSELELNISKPTIY